MKGADLALGMVRAARHPDVRTAIRAQLSDALETLPAQSQAVVVSEAFGLLGIMVVDAFDKAAQGMTLDEYVGHVRVAAQKARG